MSDEGHDIPENITHPKIRRAVQDRPILTFWLSVGGVIALGWNIVEALHRGSLL